MLGILTLAYAIGGIFCISYFICAFIGLIKGDKITGHYVQDWMVCIFTFVFVFAIYDEMDYLNNNVPDGEYMLNISVKFDEDEPAYYIPVELRIDTEKDYESGTYYAGAVEMTSTRVTRNRRFYIYEIDFRGREIRIDKYVYPEEDIEIRAGDDGMEKIILNIGVISPQRLGIKPIDNWKSEGIVGKAETILVMVSSAFFIVQYFWLDQERKKAIEEIKWSKWRKS